MSKVIIKNLSAGNQDMDPLNLKKRGKMDFRRQKLSSNFKTTFLSSLMGKREELDKTIDYLINGQKDDISSSSADNCIDELDRADREIYAQSFYKFLDRKKRELKRIDLLIERIQQEQDFGTCEECGDRIPEGRLLIIPEAVLCVPCQQELEKYESRMNLSNLSGNSHSKLDYDLQGENDPDDDGIVIRPDRERISLMDLDEIEIEDMPGPSNAEKPA